MKFVNRPSEMQYVVDELLRTMVAHDFWFYKTDEQKITANSQSLYWAFEKMLKEYSPGDA